MVEIRIEITKLWRHSIEKRGWRRSLHVIFYKELGGKLLIKLFYLAIIMIMIDEFLSRSGRSKSHPHHLPVIPTKSQSPDCIWLKKKKPHPPSSSLGESPSPLALVKPSPLNQSVSQSLPPSINTGSGQQRFGLVRLHQSEHCHGCCPC